MENLKEYLVKTEDGEYHFIPKGQKVGPTGEWIEIPEWAEILTAICGYGVFYKSGRPFQWFSEDSKKWMDCVDLVGLDGFENVLWQRDAGLIDGDCVKPTAELSGSVDIKFDWGADSTLGPELNQSDINYRAAKAFNEIKQANTLSEDDVYLVLRLVELVKGHG